MIPCIVKNCWERGVYFTRNMACGPFCKGHTRVFLALKQEVKDLIEVHQALRDPIDETYADWYAESEAMPHHRIKLGNVRIR